MYTYIHAHIRTYISVCLHTYSNIHVRTSCMHEYIHTRACMCALACMLTRAHTSPTVDFIETRDTIAPESISRIVPPSTSSSIANTRYSNALIMLGVVKRPGTNLQHASTMASNTVACCHNRRTQTTLVNYSRPRQAPAGDSVRATNAVKQETETDR